MKTSEIGRLAIDEFTFRYLYGEQERKVCFPLDELERAHQVPAPLADGAAEDLAPLFQRMVAGHAPGGTLKERLLGTLLQVHSPLTITPRSPFGSHASYPSPRAYYPLQFSLIDVAARRCYQVDMAAMRLRERAWLADAPAAGPRYCLLVQVDFLRYAALYNLFRKSLYTLECGHFLGEFVSLAHSCAITIDAEVGASGFRLDIFGEDGAGADEARFAQHRRFGRARNSGRYSHGMFPEAATLSRAQLQNLLGALDAATAELTAMFPTLPSMRLTPTLCLRAGDGVEAGMYRYTGGALECIDPADPVGAFDTLYSYPEFSFRTMPAMVFLCVDELAYACSGPDFLVMNAALGYLSQAMIRSVSGNGNGWFARPFRSYEQLGVDRLLGNRKAGLRAYYGLMTGKTRCQESVATLR